eukprot:PhM_4_TR8378/c8_g3_i4/m.65967
MGSCVSTSKQTSVVSATADPAEVSDDRDNKVKHNVDQNQEDCENRKEDEQQQQQKTSTKNMNTSAGFDSVVFGPKNPLQAPENSAEQSSNREKSTPPESSSLQEKKKQQQQQQQQRPQQQQAVQLPPGLNLNGQSQLVQTPQGTYLILVQNNNNNNNS